MSISISSLLYRVEILYEVGAVHSKVNVSEYSVRGLDFVYLYVTFHHRRLPCRQPLEEVRNKTGSQFIKCQTSHKAKERKHCAHCQLLRHLCCLYRSCLPHFKDDSSSRWVTRCTAYLQTKRTRWLLFRTIETELEECEAIVTYQKRHWMQPRILQNTQYIVVYTATILQRHFTSTVVHDGESGLFSYWW